MSFPFFTVMILHHFLSIVQTPDLDYCICKFCSPQICLKRVEFYFFS